jgi:hypothetical protein
MIGIDIEKLESIVTIVGRKMNTRGLAVESIVKIETDIGRVAMIRAIVEKDGEIELINDLVAIRLAIVEIDGDMLIGIFLTEFILAEETPNPHAICPTNCFMKEIQRSISSVKKELEIDAVSGRIAKSLG